MVWSASTISIKDATGTNQPIIAYTDATNFSFANPILDNTGAIISPATVGGQTTGNSSLSTIASIATKGITPLEPSFSITRPANTTAYAASTVINATGATSAIALTNFSSGNAAFCRVTRVQFWTNQNANTSRYRLHLFNAIPTALYADQSLMQILFADISTKLCEIDVPALRTGGSSSDTAYYDNNALNYPFIGPASATTVYCLIETPDGFTPTSGQQFAARFEVEQT